MRSFRELLSPPQTAGFTDLNFIGFDFTDLTIGLAIYGVSAGAVVAWAPIIVIVIFALLSGTGLGITIAIIGLIYLENNLPEGRWVVMPWLGGWRERK